MHEWLQAHTRVTVLMPVYNGERFVREAVEFVLKQSYRHFHFIIFNDGSTDGTAKVLQEFATDARLRIVHAPKNLGLSQARNYLLDLVDTEYFAWVDADDRCHPDWLQMQLQYLTQHPDIAAVGSWVRYIDAKGKLLPSQVWEPPTEHADIAAYMLQGAPIPNIAVMLRAEAVRHLRYREGRVAEDYAYWVRMLLNGYRFANIPEYLVEYRRHAAQISTAKRREQISCHLQSYVTQFDALGISYQASDVARHALLYQLADYESLFSNQKIALDIAFLSWAMTWLWAIAQANKNLKIYEDRALKRHLAKRWKSVCHRAVPQIGWFAALRILVSAEGGALLRGYWQSRRQAQIQTSPTKKCSATLEKVH